jgi:hypothetical protein
VKRLDEILEYLSIQSTTVAILLSSMVVGLFGSAMAGAAQFKHGGWGGVARALVIGMGVAVLVGFGVSDYVPSQTLRFAIIGGCAAIAEDIWFGLKAIGAGLRSDPLGYVGKVIDALRGKAGAGEDAK